MTTKEVVYWLVETHCFKKIGVLNQPTLAAPVKQVQVTVGHSSESLVGIFRSENKIISLI